ncbi:MAG: hypothetical protein IT479_12525 [Xanthomonadales bacterium]|nr:hypothetical protein [Xanthomonadales bacterium]MCC6594079.1 hypothetical protein [Xanthomonadales bacterium]MCE7930161.1 hypothetical protein [Xanthomonadales bacterium PRO6]
MRAFTQARPPWLAILLPVLCAALLYAPGFGGWWLGDDLTNLHHFHHWAEQGRLWRESFASFGQGISVEGSAWRPLSILSLAANQALAGSHYAGWYAANYAVHLANTALVALLVLRLAAHAHVDGELAAALAALAFALAPTLAEGVYWLSARADGWVTLLTLAATWCWAGPAQSHPRAWMPLAVGGPLLLGLLFKESAGVFPLQLALLALAWPGRVGATRWIAVLLAFALLAAFFGWRAHLFGHAFWVYAAPGEPQAAVDWLDRLGAALASGMPWWRALSAGGAPAWLYLCMLALAFVLAFLAADTAQRRIALALLAAGGGMALATLLNLGGFLAHGEGGRLSYGPIAWTALALGVLLARPLVNRPTRPLAVLAAAFAITSGALVLWSELGRVRNAQDGLAALAGALPTQVRTHPGYSLLLVPEHAGQAVLLRNAQGAIALPPIQTEGLLHRVLPTLPGELANRHERIAAGLLTRFEQHRFQHLLGDELRQLYEPAPARWPDHYLCWSMAEQRFLELPAPDPGDAHAWTATLLAQLPRCGLAER